MNNYSTHKHEMVSEWLDKHLRFQLHFTPTIAWWMNQLETWFSILTRQRIHRGSFKNVRDLVDAIKWFIDNRNDNIDPFIWMKSSDILLAKAISKGINDTLHSIGFLLYCGNKRCSHSVLWTSIQVFPLRWDNNTLTLEHMNTIIRQLSARRWYSGGGDYCFGNAIPGNVWNLHFDQFGMLV